MKRGASLLAVWQFRQTLTLQLEFFLTNLNPPRVHPRPLYFLCKDGSLPCSRATLDLQLFLQFQSFSYPPNSLLAWLQQHCLVGSEDAFISSSCFRHSTKRSGHISQQALHPLISRPKKKSRSKYDFTLASPTQPDQTSPRPIFVTEDETTPTLSRLHRPQTRSKRTQGSMADVEPVTGERK